MTDAEIIRYRVAGHGEIEDREEAVAAAEQATEAARADYADRVAQAREAHQGDLDRHQEMVDLGILEAGDATPVFAPPPPPRAVEPEEVRYRLVHDVASDRDGEIVVRGVDRPTAEREAERLIGEQIDRRQDAPVHLLAPDRAPGAIDAPPLNDGAAVPIEALNPTTYTVQDRLEMVMPETEEA